MVASTGDNASSLAGLLSARLKGSLESFPFSMGAEVVQGLKDDQASNSSSLLSQALFVSLGTSDTVFGKAEGAPSREAATTAGHIFYHPLSTTVSAVSSSSHESGVRCL